ncbi:glycosyltransferase [Stratiformator vulcanicus]|uniref:MurG-like transferase n=1 Tax=Stratiformator vulcanicus TaxID=2527980 RepID=A0A517R7I1_9PLAN|nr:glycosyltransferase [Stratiformator vulcanicus]QDT39849.1 MurG-like transferase [Stratiformator vulcanicus]
MHALLLPFGSHGDVHPFVGLGLELKRRGHRVTLATSAHFAGLAERQGLEFVPFGTEEDYEYVTTHPDLLNPRRSFNVLTHDGVGRILREQYRLIERLHHEGDLVVVANAFGFAARTAQESLGIKLVTVHLQPSMLWSDYQSPALYGITANAPRWVRRFQLWFGRNVVVDPAVRGVTDELRSELRLPPVRNTFRWWNSPDSVLGLWPEWYGPSQPDWPRQLTLTSFPLWDENQEAELPANLQQFLNRHPQPIVFTPGTANRQAASFVREAVAACDMIKRPAILLTRFGENRPKSLPESINLVDYVPLSELLPHVSAIVHPGGIGTVAQAIAAGVRQLIVPIANDQPDNASRLERLAIGLTVPMPRFNRRGAADALRQLLADEQMQRRAEELSRRLSASEGLRRAADAVERL